MTTLNIQTTALTSLAHFGESVIYAIRGIGRGIFVAQQLRANYLVSEHLVGTAAYKGMMQHEIAAQLNQSVFRTL